MLVEFWFFQQVFWEHQSFTCVNATFYAIHSPVFWVKISLLSSEMALSIPFFYRFVMKNCKLTWKSTMHAWTWISVFYFLLPQMPEKSLYVFNYPYKYNYLEILSHDTILIMEKISTCTLIKKIMTYSLLNKADVNKWFQMFKFYRRSFSCTCVIDSKILIWLLQYLKSHWTLSYLISTYMWIYNFPILETWLKKTRV